MYYVRSKIGILSIILALVLIGAAIAVFMLVSKVNSVTQDRDQLQTDVTALQRQLADAQASPSPSATPTPSATPVASASPVPTASAKIAPRTPTPTPTPIAAPLPK
jgi:cytoskeletal protein RodZ